MNAQWIGSWDVAPRSHPNDGLLDRCEGDLSLDDRWKARGRLPSGTHVPHPGIAEQRAVVHQHHRAHDDDAAPRAVNREALGDDARHADDDVFIERRRRHEFRLDL